MLVVKIELWPGGDGQRATEIARIGIANVSDLQDVSNYRVVALTRTGQEEKMVLANAMQHYRATGWVPLVSKSLLSLKEPVESFPQAERIAGLLRSGHRV